MRSSWFKKTYISLIIVRACFALFGTGYIHPDEFFQNGELTAGHIFGYHVLHTWEWDPDFALRSVMPPFVTTGLPFLLAKLLFNVQLLRPYIIFQLERFTFFVISLLLDYSVFSLVQKPESRRCALLLLASSHVMHTFQMRPFSNSIEAVLVGLCFVVFRKFLAEDGKSDKGLLTKKQVLYLHILAILSVIGIFTRVTFLAFVLPMAWQCLRWTFRISRVGPLWCSLFLPALTTILTSFAIIFTDTYYFRGELSDPTITPLNFLLYNLSPQNVAEHGLHPRWLHVFVNLPIMVGPSLLWLGALACAQVWSMPAEKRENKNRIVDQTIILTIFITLAILSIQPHQEPRFLLAFLTLFVIFVGNSGYLIFTGRSFWVIWVTINVILAVLFGILHQGGVVPSLFHLHDQISAMEVTQNARIVYWKTYMPPLHLLAIDEQVFTSGRVNITDLAGASTASLYQALHYVSGHDTSSKTSITTTFLVTPFPMQATLAVGITNCLFLDYRLFPHLDLDHIGESLDAGWVDGLSLGIWTVDRNCLSATTEKLD